MLRRSKSGKPYWLGIISHRRPTMVEDMDKIVGKATWYVRPTDLETYGIYIRKFGHVIIPIETGLCGARNAILKDAYEKGVDSIQLSDDLRRLWKVEFIDPEDPGSDWSLPQAKQSHKKRCPITWGEVVAEMFALKESSGSKLVGCSSTDSLLWVTKDVRLRTFIVGDLMLTDPQAYADGIKFDEELKLKEDYDVTIQHLERYGITARVETILANFHHGTNKGGAVDYRNANTEQEAIARLCEKWNKDGKIPWIKPHPKRPNEVVLNTSHLNR